MNLELIISIVAICLAFVAALMAASCFIQLKSYRAALLQSAQQIVQLEMLLGKPTEIPEEISQKLSDHARRLAWVENKVRQPKSIEEDKFVGNVDSVHKPNITERRHRVLKLHSRGQDAETIAATLGMLHGEVELIINLNQTN